jgi:hypothetical protein
MFPPTKDRVTDQTRNWVQTGVTPNGTILFLAVTADADVTNGRPSGDAALR